MQTTGLIRNNPAAVLGMALPFIVVPSTSLKSAVIISVFILAATVPCAVAASFIRDRLAGLYTVPVYCILSMIIVMITRVFMKGQAVTLDELGIYIPLIALNSIMIELSAVSPRKKPMGAVADSLMMCLGFAAVCCIIGALREILGSQTIWGIPVKFYPVRLFGVALPFFGFIMIAFITAFFRSIDRGIKRAILVSPDVALPKSAEGESAGDKV